MRIDGRAECLLLAFLCQVLCGATKYVEACTVCLRIYGLREGVIGTYKGGSFKKGNYEFLLV